MLAPTQISVTGGELSLRDLYLLWIANVLVLCSWYFHFFFLFYYTGQSVCLLSALKGKTISIFSRCKKTYHFHHTEIVSLFQGHLLWNILKKVTWRKVHLVLLLMRCAEIWRMHGELPLDTKSRKVKNMPVTYKAVLPELRKDRPC